MSWKISGTLVFLSLAVIGVVEVAGQERVDLSGSWQIDRDASDDPRQEIAEAASGRRGPGSAGQMGGSRPGGRGGFGGARGGGGGRGAGGGNRGEFTEEDREQMRQIRQSATALIQQFTIVQTDSAITFAFDDTAQLLLLTDGRKLKQEIDVLGDVEIKAKWKDGALVVERKMDGAKITEHYSRPQYTERLIVTTKVEFSRLPRAIEFQRVYDPKN